MVTLAQAVADQFAVGLDLEHLSRTQCLILHAIKGQAMSQWARETLAKEKHEARS